MAKLDITAKVDERLAAALRLALSVIESYQLDIRNAKETIGVDLVGKGFCQGTVYKEAEADIMAALKGKEQDDVRLYSKDLKA